MIRVLSIKKKYDRRLKRAQPFRGSWVQSRIGESDFFQSLFSNRMRTRPSLTTVLRRVGEFNTSLIARLKLLRKIDYNQIATTKKIKLKKNRCRILNAAPYGPSNIDEKPTEPKTWLRRLSGPNAFKILKLNMEYTLNV